MKINIINTTTDSIKIARIIAEDLINKKISPCVQILPKIESIYKWHGKIECSKEFLLIIKIIPDHIHECKKHVKKLHNYDNPEIIVIEGEILLDTYKEWFLEHSGK